MESLFLDLLKNAPSTGFIALMLWYGMKDIGGKLDKMARRMDCFESSQHACQLDVAKTYATKDELQSVEVSLANHESRISRIEGRQ